MISVSEWKRRLQKLGQTERPRAERRIPVGLSAWHGDHLSPRLDKVRDISITGLFLVTEERWPIGETINLTLQGEGQPEDEAELQIEVQAKVVHCKEDGVGLTFVLPAPVDRNLWGVLIHRAAVLTEPKDILFTFKMLRTIFFLYRLCPSGAEQSIVLLGGELDDIRTDSALEIALRAEKLVDALPDAANLRAHPNVVANILKNGSWEHDELTRQMWAGLLADSCSLAGDDESNMPFIELLINITPNQARILQAGCSKALELLSRGEELKQKSVVRTPEEMIEITNMYDLTRLATDVAYLYNFGLLVELFDFTSYLPMDSYNITPTSFGLDLYKHCRMA